MSGARRRSRGPSRATSRALLDVFDAASVEAGQCPVCARPSTLVVPACTEGHGDECPDRLCLDCGSALFVAPANVALAQSA